MGGQSPLSGYLLFRDSLSAAILSADRDFPQ
jgi:hypothetical protein